MDNSPRRFAAVALIVVAPWLWLFGPVVVSDQVMAFRDAGNLYYPLFRWQCSEWGAGRVPLWNAYDNLGSATFADATSSVLYPGKLLFALPGSFALRFNLYIAVHVLFAAGSAYSLARRWNCSHAAAGLAAISYAYGGYTVFQYCNVVYLVGAAWLPLAVGFADAMLIERSMRYATSFGLVLAMMTLGGDPQTAYHMGMMAVLYSVVMWWCDKRTDSPALLDSTTKGLWRSRPVLLAAAAGISCGLSAVQIFPSAEWARRSQRASYDRPRNVYEAAGTIIRASKTDSPSQAWAKIGAGLVGAPPVDTHAAHVYYYSLGPWRMAEFVWPNVAGKMFPIHRRWLSSLPAEGRIWNPSLYCGVIPIIAAICAWRWREGTYRDRWAITMFVVGIVGSFGWYGIGWVLEEVRASLSLNAQPSPIGQPTGGLYWFFSVLLPGYTYFRYPAKWLVVASLGLSLLSARGMDRLSTSPQMARRVAVWLTSFSFVCVLLSLLLRSAFLDWASGARANELFGPLDAHGSWRDLVTAFAQTMLVGLSFLLATRSGLRQRLGGPLFWLLLIAAVDVVIANRWLVATTPVRTLENGSIGISGVAPSHDAIGTPPLRIVHNQRQSWTPHEWRTFSDSDRIAVVCEWERQSLLHKHHLAQGIASLDTRSTLFPAEFRALLNVLRTRSDRDELLERLGVHYVISSRSWTKAKASEPGVRSETGSLRDHEVQITKLSAEALPRAWIARDVHVLDMPAADRSLHELETRLQQMWLTSTPDSPRSGTRPVYVDALPAGLELRGNSIAATESCVIRRYEPQCVEMDVVLRSPGLVVLNDLFDSGWKANVQTNDQVASRSPIVCVNGLIRGVWLPSGTHQLIMVYRPKSLFIGAICTLLTAVLVMGILLRCRNELGTRITSSKLCVIAPHPVPPPHELAAR